MDIAELSDIQAEGGVIGTLIFHPEYILNSNTFLKAGHFYNVENGCVYWAIQELVNDGIANIDALNLSNKLNSHRGVKNTIEKYNLPAVQDLIDLYKEAARTTVEEYLMLAKTITSFAFKRNLYRRLSKLSAECFDNNLSLNELNENVYQELDTLTSDFVLNSDEKLFGDEFDDIWAEIVSRRTGDGMYGMPSKYECFNEYFSYETGELFVVQAKYKQGKSAFLMNEVVHKLRCGIPVLVIDREMRTRLYTERLIAHISSVPIKKIKSGIMSDEEKQKIKDAIGWIKQQKFKHIYKPELSMTELYAICKFWINKIGVKFIVFDYLKSNEGDTGKNYNLLGEQCDFLKNRIAGELDVAVLAAAQLNRNGDVADSIKINQYLSVAIKYGQKSKDRIAQDTPDCGNIYAKIYINRLGESQDENDDDDFFDLYFDGSTMTISECKQHSRDNTF